MADFRAIAAIGKAIVGLLNDATPRDELDGVEVILAEPSDFRKSQSPATQRIALYLYRVSPGGSQPNSRPRVEPFTGGRFKASIVVDLNYLLLAYGGSAEFQQRLLGWAMRTLADTPVLHGALLNDYYDAQHSPFSNAESVDLVCEPLSVHDMVDAQEALKPNVQLAVGYVVRRVLLDSRVSVSEHDPVQTRQFDYVAVENA